MIFIEKKICYIHIPKCGGTFLRNQLLKNKKKTFLDISGNYFVKKKNKNLDLSHLTYDEFIKLYPLKNLLKNKIKFFTIIRNPHERFISSFKEYLKQKYFNNNLIYICDDNKVLEIYYNLIKNLKKATKNNWNKYSSDLIYFKPQHLFFQNISKHNIKIFKFNSSKLNKYLLKFNININDKRNTLKIIRKSYIYHTNNFFFILLSKFNYIFLNRTLQYFTRKFYFNLDKIIPSLKDDISKIYKNDYKLYNNL